MLTGVNLCLDSTVYLVIVGIVMIKWYAHMGHINTWLINHANVLLLLSSKLSLDSTSVDTCKILL